MSSIFSPGDSGVRIVDMLSGGGGTGSTPQAASLAYTALIYTLVCFPLLMIAGVLAILGHKLFDWSDPAVFLVWGVLTFSFASLAFLVGLRELRRAPTIHTGTSSFHLISVVSAVAFAFARFRMGDGGPYGGQFLQVGRILVEILILFFFLSYLFFAWAVKMGTKPIHLFCPAVSLLTIAWLAYTFPA
ncbi:MAG: hypothetical protein VCA38_12940 [Roseibacillus sp.]